MFALGTFAAALNCASALDFQKHWTIPLLQNPLNADADDAPTPGAANLDKKPLVDSEALQAKINQDSLLARAKELYEIAKLSEHEYNHPTRVIGSPGRYKRRRYHHYSRLINTACSQLSARAHQSS